MGETVCQELLGGMDFEARKTESECKSPTAHRRASFHSVSSPEGDTDAMSRQRSERPQCGMQRGELRPK